MVEERLGRLVTDDVQAGPGPLTYCHCRRARVQPLEVRSELARSPAIPDLGLVTAIGRCRRVDDREV